MIDLHKYPEVLKCCCGLSLEVCMKMFCDDAFREILPQPHSDGLFKLTWKQHIFELFKMYIKNVI